LYRESSTTVETTALAADESINEYITYKLTLFTYNVIVTSTRQHLNNFPHKWLFNTS